MTSEQIALILLAWRCEFLLEALAEALNWAADPSTYWGTDAGKDARARLWAIVEEPACPES